MACCMFIRSFPIAVLVLVQEQYSRSLHWLHVLLLLVDGAQLLRVRQRQPTNYVVKGVSSSEGRKGEREREKGGEMQGQEQRHRLTRNGEAAADTQAIQEEDCHESRSL